jgi:hypothetical protein
MSNSSNHRNTAVVAAVILISVMLVCGTLLVSFNPILLGGSGGSSGGAGYSVGLTGAQGPQGIQGLIGTMGSPGVDGLNFNASGNVWLYNGTNGSGALATQSLPYSNITGTPSGVNDFSYLMGEGNGTFPIGVPSGQYYVELGLTGQIISSLTSARAGVTLQGMINLDVASGGGTMGMVDNNGVYNVTDMSFQNIDYTGGINVAQIIIPGVASNYPTGAPTINIALVAVTPTRGGWEQYMPVGLTSGGVTILSQAMPLSGEHVSWLFGVQAIVPDAINNLAVGASSNINLYIDGINFQTSPTGISGVNTYFAGTCNIGTIHIGTYYTTGMFPSQMNPGTGFSYGANGIQSMEGGDAQLIYVSGFALGLDTSDGHNTIASYYSQQNTIGLRVQGGGYNFEMITYSAQLTPILIQSTSYASIIIDHIAMGDGQNLTIDANNGVYASIIIGSVISDGAETAAPIITNFNVIGTTVTIDHFLIYQGQPPINIKCVSGGLDGYWHLNENFGNYAMDSAGKGNIGTLSASGTQWTGGFNGNGLQITGSSGQVIIPNTPSLNLGTSNFTISAWIKSSTANAFGRIVNKGSYSYGFYVLANGKLGVIVYGLYNVVSSGVNVCNGQWNYVSVAVNRAGLATFYVNGVLDSTFDVSSQLSASLNSSYALNIGNDLSSFGTDWFNGTISSVQISLSCWTASQELTQYYLGM